MKINAAISKKHKTLNTRDESFFFFFSSSRVSPRCYDLLSRPDLWCLVVFKKKQKKNRWGFGPPGVFFFSSFELKSQSLGGLFSIVFFFFPSAYQSKRVRHVKWVVSSGYDAWFRMMPARFRWGGTVLTAGPRREPWGGAFLQEEERSALGGTNTGPTVKDKNFYLHLLLHLFLDRYLKLTVESRGGAGTGVGGRSLARGVRG